MKVRPALPEDEPQALEVASQAFAELRHIYAPTPAAQTSARELLPQTERFVAEVDGVIAGTVRCYIKDNTLRIMALAVRKEYRRQGVARALLQQCAAHAQVRGLSKLATYTVKETGNVPI